MAKNSAAGSSKSEMIRNYKSRHAEAGPTAIAAALSKDGTKVSPQFVSTGLSNDKRRARKGRRKGMRHGGRQRGSDPLQTLVQAKKLADQMGGVEKAREALDALAKILG